MRQLAFVVLRVEAHWVNGDTVFLCVVVDALQSRGNAGFQRLLQIRGEGRPRNVLMEHRVIRVYCTGRGGGPFNYLLEAQCNIAGRS